MDMKKPGKWYPLARTMKREIILHVGPTNSGKTHAAMERLKKSSSGVYCSPLRLLAWEISETLNKYGTKCDLVTGQELKRVEDEKVIEYLVKIKGIGRWTAEMFLIFYLLRPNIFPSTDIGLLRAISINYNLKYPLKNTEIKKFQKKWDPWSTVATWYLWRSLDPIPVKY